MLESGFSVSFDFRMFLFMQASATTRITKKYISSYPDMRLKPANKPNKPPNDAETSKVVRLLTIIAIQSIKIGGCLIFSETISIFWCFLQQEQRFRFFYEATKHFGFFYASWALINDKKNFLKDAAETIIVKNDKNHFPHKKLREKCWISKIHLKNEVDNKNRKNSMNNCDLVESKACLMHA